MISTKLWRLPTRGALGNGLRVVAGAVLASQGTLVVCTRNRRITLQPQMDGSTAVSDIQEIDFHAGTRIEVSFGDALPADINALAKAMIACFLARFGESYSGKSSPHWYDAAQFHELLYAGGDRPVRELISQLDGCTGARAGEIVTAAGLERAVCNKLTQQQAARLLGVAQTAARQVSPARLGAIGPDAFPGYAYAIARGVVRNSGEIPFVVEAWARETDFDTLLSVYVNRTPITGTVHAARDKREINFFGCNLAHTVATAPKDLEFDIHLNIMTPYMPITSDGKAPNLRAFLDGIKTAVGKAVKAAHRPGGGRSNMKTVVLDNLDEAIETVSDDHRYRFN
jgi:hypothetical protein